MTYLLGFRSEAIETVALDVSKALGITLEPSESGSRGCGYFRSENENAFCVLQKNRSEGFFADFAEPDFAEYPVLMYIDTPLNERAFGRWTEKLDAELLRASTY